MNIDQEDILLNYNKIDTLTWPHNANSINLINNLKHIKICHMNIRSLRKNIDEFTILLQSLDSNIHFIVLTEAFLHDSLPIISIPGYSQISAQGNLTRNEGVIVFYKNDWNADVTAHKLNDCTSVLVEFKKNKLTIPLLCIYRTPSIANTDNFTQSLEEILTCSKVKPIIIGDININIENKTDLRVDNYLNTLATFGYISVINKPTRVTETTSSCIDHIFVPETVKEHMEITGIILKTSITDHFTEFLILKNDNLATNLAPNEQTQQTRKKIDYEKLNHLLEHETWEEVLTMSDVNEAYEIFLNKFTEYINTSSSIIRQRQINSKEKKLKPWINHHLVKLIRHRDELLDKSKKYTDIQFKRYAKDFANSVKTQIRNTKNAYFKNKLEQAGTNMQKIWSTVNEITNKSIKHADHIKTIEVNGQEINESTQIANYFNTKFLNCAQSLNANAASTSVSREQLENIPFNADTIQLTMISENDILTKINSLKNSKSKGADNIDTETLKQTKEHIKIPLCFIVNQMLQQGVYPNLLKKSIVIPIFKGGNNKKDPDKYRPISILPILSKVFEKILLDKLEKFADEHELINKNQYGFRKNTGTNEAINDLCYAIHKAKETKQFNLCLFLDLSKAYDTIPHFALVKKLHKMGIRGKAEDLIVSYLENRPQITKIGNSFSNEGFITTGLPQGTIVSPLLFNLYVNDLLQLELSGETGAFADDTRHLCTGKNRKELYENANKDFEKIKNWLTINLLTLNTDKTVYIEFTTKMRNDNLSYSVNGIQRVSETKYLGIIVDEGLKWDSHINNVTCKIRKTIYKFIQLRQCTSLEIQKMVYFSLVQSHLSYGIVAWGGAYQNVIEKLSLMQRKILKIIYKKPNRFPSEELYRLSNVFNIKQLYIKEAVINIYKNRENLQTPNHNHDTRLNAQQPIVQSPNRTNFTQKQARYIGKKYYNELPTSIKTSLTIQTFKLKLKKHMRDTLF